jgi:hypothetical protein
MRGIGSRPSFSLLHGEGAPSLPELDQGLRLRLHVCRKWPGWWMFEKFGQRFAGFNILVLISYPMTVTTVTDPVTVATHHLHIFTIGNALTWDIVKHLQLRNAFQYTFPRYTITLPERVEA